MSDAGRSSVDWFAVGATHQMRRLGQAAALADELGLPIDARDEVFAALFGDQRLRARSSEPPPFIGREKELAELYALIRRDDVRVLTLTGPGGSGKTRLAQEIVSHVEQDFADGAIFVPLASIEDPLFVLPTIAHAFGVWDRTGHDLDETLTAYLRDRSALLVLDGVEHVREATPLLNGLLSASQGLKVVVTSRIPLAIDGDHRYPVRPLEFPDWSDLAQPIGVELQSEAVRLFMLRAVRPGSVPDARNVRLSVHICNQLRGLPLAIELAAARSATTSPGLVQESLANLVLPLEEGARRNTTVAQTIAWSYSLLTPGAQKLLRCASAFPGGCTFEDLSAATETSGFTPDVEAGLWSLTSVGLIEPPSLQSDDQPYTLLDPIREFALAELERHGEADDVGDRLMRYYVGFAEEMEARLEGAGQTAAINALSMEYPNLRSAMTLSIQRSDWESLARLAGALARFWIRRGYLGDGQRWLEHALTRQAELSPGLQAKVLLRSGILAYLQGDYDLAVRRYREAMRLYQGLADDSGTADALTNLGHVSYRQGMTREAQAFYENGLEVARRSGDKYLIANALHGLGNLSNGVGDFAQAANIYAESIALRKEIGDLKGVSDSLNSLGIIIHDHGGDDRYERAEQLYTEGLAIREELGDKLSIAISLQNLGALAQDRQQDDLATDLYRRSLRLYDAVGDQRGVADSLSNLGAVANDLGELDRAAERYEEALAAYRKMGDSFGIAKSIRNLGLVARDKGDLKQAITLYQNSLALYRELRDPLALAESYELLAEAIMTYLPNTAARHYGAAQVLRKRLNSPAAPRDSQRHERNVEMIRRQLGDVRFNAEWMTGRANTEEETLAEALSPDLISSIKPPSD